VRGRAGRDEVPSKLRANMGNDSTECDNCQGNGTKFVSFELRRNKWNGWKGLAGIWEFGETKTEKSLGWLAKKLETSRFFLGLRPSLGLTVGQGWGDGAAVSLVQNKCQQ
jgi:hypothetical protein